MRIPTIQGIIDRRILVNFRVDPKVLARHCPPPFEPQLIAGYGIAGICLIRLKSVRPRFLPAWSGIQSENAAHRIAVQWHQDGQTKTGVYIPRRDTSSRLNAWAGGRIFPGVHHHARFKVQEENGVYRVEMNSEDGVTRVSVNGTVAPELPSTSLFSSVAEVSRFFESGSLGYSPANSDGEYDGLELRTFHWECQPLNVTEVHSSFFEDSEQFPADSVCFDNALLMQQIKHQWHSRDSICCPTNA